MLQHDLSDVLPQYQQRVHRPGGMTDAELVALVSRPDADPAMYHPDYADTKCVIDALTEVTPEHEALGEQALKDGTVAFVVLAGDVSWSSSLLGGPKAFAKLPTVGLSLLGWHLLQAGQMPVWVMTTPDMSQLFLHHVSALAVPMGLNGTLFEQFEGYRLNPDNSVQTFGHGVPGLYPLGHGDMGPALVESGVLDDNPQVKHVVVCNVDNVLGGPHAGIIGHHISRQRKVTCEVVEKQPSDRGGVLAWVNSRLQIAEDFRLPEGFAGASRYYNTNTMVIDVDVLRWPIPWRWHRVSRRAGEGIVIQYERLLQQYTEECETDFVLVPRAARYLPVKTSDDLAHADQVLAAYRFT
jgi:UTP--glucose-1-phosphate uridylyltransferase